MDRTNRNHLEIYEKLYPEDRRNSGVCIFYILEIEEFMFRGLYILCPGDRRIYITGIGEFIYLGSENLYLWDRKIHIPGIGEFINLGSENLYPGDRRIHIPGDKTISPDIPVSSQFISRL